MISPGWAVAALVLYLCAGVALMVPTPVAILTLVCLVTAVQIQVRVVEEPYLRRVHGEAYLPASAGRFLPRPGRRAEQDPTPPSSSDGGRA